MQLYVSLKYMDDELYGFELCNNIVDAYNVENVKRVIVKTLSILDFISPTLNAGEDNIIYLCEKNNTFDLATSNIIPPDIYYEIYGPVLYKTINRKELLRLLS